MKAPIYKQFLFRTLLARKTFKRLSIIVAHLVLVPLFTSAQSFPEMYNVVWNTPSANSAESMPLGGHDIGCNVWVENGDILFYAAQSGAWDENNESLKMGRFRISLNPNPFINCTTFRQELKLNEGYIQIEANHPNHGKTMVNLWVEVHRPVIHVDLEPDQAKEVKLAYETWRFENDTIEAIETDPVAGRRASPFDFDGLLLDLVKYGDQFVPNKNEFIWYHNNGSRFSAFDLAVKEEGLSAIENRLWNPLQNLISGGMIYGDHLHFTGEITVGKYFQTPYKAWIYSTKKSVGKEHITIIAQTKNCSDEEWNDSIVHIKNDSKNRDQLWGENISWWDNFWNQSYIILKPEQDSSDKTWTLGRNYNLFRYQLGGNTYGQYPTKFNGGNLTFDPGHVTDRFPYDPDFRRWGGGTFTAQNQRLVYWPMLKTGDFEAMLPQFEFYRKATGNATLRTQEYWGHNGVSFTEQMQQSGLPAVSHYGFSTNGYGIFKRPADYEKGVQYNRYVGTLYQTQLEFAYMMLQYYFYSGEDISKYLPFIESCIIFYDEHYQQINVQLTGKPLNDEGKLVLYPTTAGEAHRNSTNAADAVAGMRAVLIALQNLPAHLLSNEQSTYFKAVLERTPELPISFETIDGKEMGFLNESLYDSAWMSAFVPVLYSVYPFDLAIPGTKEIEYAKNVWNHKLNNDRRFNYQSWRPGAFMAARLGFLETAQSLTTKKLGNSPRRYPTFWGPGHDWVPDHNWGGSAMIALQEMLMQTFDKQIILFPTWPADWDVKFKLHAPYKTTIEGELKNGKIEYMNIDPPSRRDDIIIKLKPEQ